MKNKKGDWYIEVTCDTWEDFLKKAKNYEKKEKEKYKKDGGVFYRGQNDKKQKLESSFDRAVIASSPLKDGYKRWQYEAAILREFMRRAHQYITHVPKEENLLEWLSLMRHYGAPTRLVDFTYSHYIAAYFAFSSLKKTSRAVWAINLGWLREVTTERIGEDDLHEYENFMKHFLNPDSPASFVAALNAERMNERLTIQQGVFLCPGNIGQSFEKNLISMQPRKGSIVKFVIPHSERNKALTELKHMNISNATLFPDLGGFAESLNDRFELLFKDYHIPEKTLRKVITCLKSSGAVKVPIAPFEPLSAGQSEN